MMDLQMAGFMAGWMVLWGLLALALLTLVVVATIWLLVNLSTRKRDGGSPQSQTQPPDMR